MLKINAPVPRKSSVLWIASLMSLVNFACNKTQFGGEQYRAVREEAGPSSQNGSGTPTPQYDAKGDPIPFGTPVSPEVSQPGWVGSEVRSQVDAIFSTGAAPNYYTDASTGNGGAPGTSGAPGTTPGGTTPGFPGIPGIPNIPGLPGIPGIPGLPGIGGGPRINTDASTGSGSNPTLGQKILNDSAGVLWLACRKDGQDAGQFPNEFYAKAGTTVRVAGEFCPEAKPSGEITILFVIDRSGSMEGTAGEGPNDKTTNGSCGRLRAADLIVKKYQAMLNTTIKAGVVRFATQSEVKIPVGELDAVANSLNPATFCGSETGTAQLTNYHAALNTAADQLANIPGDKIVYFISDGSPTTGQGDPKQSGLTAAQRLRSIPGVSMFALFVGYNAGSAVNPRAYLEQVTGDAKLVRVTSNADELVRAAATLGTIPVFMKAADATATLENPAGVRNLKIEEFAPRQDMPNRYYWVTEPFILVGTPTAATLNKLTVTGKVSTGDTLSSVANISYHELLPK
ncbi:MAG: VWA domain-containing protein [Deltaproteobacteria bacterium]|nr:VWA domain-containing protein [Deltaproteobacteria bacterium]